MDTVATQLVATAMTAADGAAASAGTPWWVWPCVLLVFTFVLGIVAVLGGVGGGVLFVPLVSGFFPFHIDFVRSAGLLVAIASSLSASPELLRRGLANLRLSLLPGVAASIGSIAGAMVGLAMPERAVQTALGAVMLVVFVVMATAGRSEYPEVRAQSAIMAALRVGGAYHDPSEDRTIVWSAHRATRSLLLFLAIGFVGGAFGLGAGWANVPVLNLVMGVPLKVAVGSSHLLIAMSGTPAAWVYLQRGAMLPLLVVPSVVGMMLGARIGARLLVHSRPRGVRWIVLGILLLAGARTLLKGLGAWN